MASIAPGTQVRLKQPHGRLLARPPRPGTDLHIAVHPAALKAPANRATLVAGFRGNKLDWVGALDESMLDEVAGGARADARRAMFPHLLSGGDLWRIIRPGELLASSARSFGTVYKGDRPWLVVGALDDGLLAVPLNDPGMGPKWFTPVIPQRHLHFTGATKDSMVELAHLWSFPMTARAVGHLDDAAHAGVSEAIRKYFGAATEPRR